MLEIMLEKAHCARHIYNFFAHFPMPFYQKLSFKHNLTTLFFGAFPGPRARPFCFVLFDETTRVLARSEGFGLLNWDKAFFMTSELSDGAGPVKSTAVVSESELSAMTDYE